MMIICLLWGFCCQIVLVFCQRVRLKFTLPHQWRMLTWDLLKVWCVRTWDKVTVSRYYHRYPTWKHFIILSRSNHQPLQPFFGQIIWLTPLCWTYLSLKLPWIAIPVISKASHSYALSFSIEGWLIFSREKLWTIWGLHSESSRYMLFVWNLLVLM